MNKSQPRRAFLLLLFMPPRMALETYSARLQRSKPHSRRAFLLLLDMLQL
jgi:hypothetical protein